MTIAQYLRVLREQWLVVVAVTVLSALGAAGYAFAQTPVYQASAQLFISTSSHDSDISQLTQGGTFTQQRVKSYSDIVASPPVLQAVIDQLQLPYAARELADNVTSSSPLDTVLLNITVTDASPERARDIANAIAVQFPKLVDTLETPAGQVVSPVKISITQHAVTPQVAISPRKTLDLALGLLVGLGLGVGAAVLRDSLDRTVSSKQQAADIAGAAVLGAVPDEPQVGSAPLITHDAFSARAEAFRQLRTNIRFLSVDQKLHSLVVTGSVEGEGKTTTAANLAIALAQGGEQVVLVDADLRRPSVADVFGLPSGVGLTTVLLGELPLEQALQGWRPDLPLRILAAGPLPPNPSELIGSSRMAAMIEALTKVGNTVILDSPPLLPVTDAAVLARVTDGALVVTRAASTRTDQLAAAIESLRVAGAPILGVVLNRVPSKGKGGAAGYGRYSAYAGTEQRDMPTGAPGELQPAQLPAVSAAGRLAPAPHTVLDLPIPAASEQTPSGLWWIDQGAAEATSTNGRKAGRRSAGPAVDVGTSFVDLTTPAPQGTRRPDLHSVPQQATGSATNPNDVNGVNGAGVSVNGVNGHGAPAGRTRHRR